MTALPYMTPFGGGTRSHDIELRMAAASFSYGGGANALNDVSFTARAGELVAIVGPNGCGKSTLLKALCGQITLKPGGTVTLKTSELPQERRIDVGAAGRLRPEELARYLALVPQTTSVGFAYSVRQVVLMGRWPAHASGGGLSTAMGFETAEDQTLADHAMWNMDVHHLVDRPLNQLSGGERQRVIIARALAQQTPAMLLDEPTSALDLFHQLDLMNRLHTLAHEQKMAIVLVTHDLNLALRFADRVAVMDGGRIIAEGPPRETLTAAVLEPVYRVQVAGGDGDLLRFNLNNGASGGAARPA